MRKISLVLIIVIAVLGFSGCGGNDAAPDEEQISDQSAVIETQESEELPLLESLSFNTTRDEAIAYLNILSDGTPLKAFNQYESGYAMIIGNGVAACFVHDYDSGKIPADKTIENFVVYDNFEGEIIEGVTSKTSINDLESLADKYQIDLMLSEEAELVAVIYDPKTASKVKLNYYAVGVTEAPTSVFVDDINNNNYGVDLAHLIPGLNNPEAEMYDYESDEIIPMGITCLELYQDTWQDAEPYAYNTSNIAELPDYDTYDYSAEQKRQELEMEIEAKVRQQLAAEEEAAEREAAKSNYATGEEPRVGDYVVALDKPTIRGVVTSVSQSTISVDWVAYENLVGEIIRYPKAYSPFLPSKPETNQAPANLVLIQ
jgi:hypothetical protein